jgi:cytochrome c oxidase subunit 2
MFKFHHYIMAILVGIFVTVSYLMYTSLVGDLYSRSFTDHPTLETVWTIVPAVVLLFIAFPSLRLLYVMDEVMNPSITLKAIGNQ